jgi:hypothetical protein
MVSFTAMTSVTRELLPGGVVRLTSNQATFEYSRPRPGRLLVTISGTDKGQFGPSTLDEITAALEREGSVELFIDAREAVGVAASVSDDWTRFFSVQRTRLRRVHVLAGSKAVKLTVAIAQHLSRTGDLMQMYSDPQIFDGRLHSDSGFTRAVSRNS